MHISSYERVETAAGGVTCTEREFIRQAVKLCSTVGRSRDMRLTRHNWIRSGLMTLRKAKTLHAVTS